jgi:hypothetical protein
MNPVFGLDDAIALARRAHAGQTDTEQDLRAAGCPEPVIAAVRALTKRSGEPLQDSMARAAANPIAQIVERADIAVNSDPSRLALLGPATAQRLRRKYADSLRFLDRHTGSAPGRTDGR